MDVDLVCLTNFPNRSVKKKKKIITKKQVFRKLKFYTCLCISPRPLTQPKPKRGRHAHLEKRKKKKIVPGNHQNK